jgi:hypothetical protein
MKRWLSLAWLAALLLSQCATALLQKSRIVGLGQNQPKLKPLTEPLLGSLFDDEEDPEDGEQFRKMAQTYLMNKYRDCREDPDSGDLNCRFICDQGQIKEILVSLLPPVTKEALDEEVEEIMSKFKGEELVEGEAFVNAMMENSYWAQAGPLVVKELIYLDCLFHYYRNNQQLLLDDQYSELKDQLTWEGSAVPTMTGSEALFLNAVASSRRGQASLSDEEYNELKKKLQGEQSWVTSRMEDPLEKLGLSTFLGYLHDSL